MAMRKIEKAMELDPGNVGVLIERSRILTLANDVENALIAAQTAQELDPVSTAAAQILGNAYYMARRYDEAIPAFQHALELDPYYPRPHYGIAMCMFLSGDAESAAPIVAQEPLEWMRLSGLAILQRKLGLDDAAEEAMAALIESYRDNGLYQQAQVHGQWGDIETAVEVLYKARDLNDPGVSQIIVDPLIDPLRQNPKFAALLAEISDS